MRSCSAILLHRTTASSLCHSGCATQFPVPWHALHRGTGHSPATALPAPSQNNQSGPDPPIKPPEPKGILTQQEASTLHQSIFHVSKSSNHLCPKKQSWKHVHRDPCTYFRSLGTPSCSLEHNPQVILNSMLFLSVPRGNNKGKTADKNGTKFHHSQRIRMVRRSSEEGISCDLHEQLLKHIVNPSHQLLGDRSNAWSIYLPFQPPDLSASNPRQHHSGTEAAIQQQRVRLTTPHLCWRTGLKAGNLDSPASAATAPWASLLQPGHQCSHLPSALLEGGLQLSTLRTRSWSSPTLRFNL